MKKIVFFIITAAIIYVPIFAQGTERTVEERYLSTSVEVAIVSQLAAGDTREQKLVALDTIENMIADGRVNKNDIQINNVLTNLAGEGTFIVVREGTRRVNNFPEVRTRAAKVLGDLGGERAKDSLIDIAGKENEPMVLSQVVFSLGTIGINDNNDALLAISRVLEANSRRRQPDDNLAVAALLAIEKIAEANNGFPQDPDPTFMYRAIIEVQEGNYSTNVRKWAAVLLDKLRKY